MSSPTHPAANDPHGNRLIDDMLWLGRLAARLVSDPGLADDACQEAWMSASASSGGQPTREELALGVRRFLAMYWRGSARRRAREHASARRDVAPAVDQLLARRESQTRIWNELVRLRDPYRHILFMRFQEGLTTRQIADSTGTKPDTVRRHIRDGIAVLRQRLEADRAGGGLAGVFAAIPASLQEGAVTADAGVRLGFSATGVKFGAAVVALAALAFVLLTALTEPIAPSAESVPVAESTLGSLDLETNLSTPAPREERAMLRGPSPSDGPSPGESDADASPAPAARTPTGDPSAYDLRLRLHTHEGVALPQRVTSVVECMLDAGTVLEKVKGAYDVEDGHIDFVLDSADPMVLDMMTLVQVTLTAEGFGTQTSKPIALTWTHTAPPAGDLFLFPAIAMPVRVVEAESWEPISNAQLTMRGASHGVARSLRTDGEGAALLPLIVPTGPEAEKAEDHLFVHKKGKAIGHWTRAELEQLPLQRDGTRTLELVRPSTVRGKIAMESGEPLPAGATLSYSMERSREQSSFDFPHWLEPEGKIRVSEGGRFEIDGLTMGLLVLHPQASRRRDAPALGPDLMVDIPASEDLEVTLVIPADPVVLTLNLEWLSPNQSLFVRLYEMDSADSPYLDAPTPRTLLFKKNWFPVLRDVPIMVPRGSIEDGKQYLLEVGPDFDRFVERLISFEGEAPRLEHSFAEAALGECPFNDGDTPAEQLQANRALARARKAGAKVLLRARTE